MTYKDNSKPTPEKSYEYVSNLLDREITLVDQRLKWFLTFNGFIFTAFILSFKEEDANLVLRIAHFIFPVAGIFISMTIHQSIRASESARDRIKKHWERVGNNNFPPAYSKTSISEIGRNSSKSIPIMVGSIWAIFLVSIIFSLLSLHDN